MPSHVREKIDACVEGPEGASLLAASAATVQARSVVNSCTVAIGGKQRCVRDGGEWRDCPGGSGDGDFIASLCAASREKTGRDADVCGEVLKAAAAAVAAAKKP